MLATSRLRINVCYILYFKYFYLLQFNKTSTNVTDVYGWNFNALDIFSEAYLCGVFFVHFVQNSFFLTFISR